MNTLPGSRCPAWVWPVAVLGWVYLFGAFVALGGLPLTAYVPAVRQFQIVPGYQIAPNR